ncbi:nicotinamide N-methyltransferase [Parasteatoda tepidariorum]|uniref:nicotinamide N-methyltransferase n=1 Tax=Parasteatoda tepidariorum TaxID=114398 RepID=UPI001C71F034|nr:nicotinamide N-methyltransferase isoform X2 [Parasteatoda tepidariorum]
MASQEEKIKEDYQKNLDPIEFQEFKLKGLKNEKTENNYDFWFSCLYEYFTTEKFSGARLLDLGSGPTVHNVATASAYFPHIVLSEFVESNCEQLRKWVRKDPDCIDWSPFLERVAKAEKRTDVKAAAKEIEDRIRSSVKAVIHCDVLDDQVIAKEYAQQPYDMILTALTLETAAVDLKSYSKIVGRVNQLLRKGGKLVMIGPIKCTYWKVGDNKFHCLPVGEDDIQKALEKNGFGDIKWKVRDLPDDDLPFDCSKLYFVTSTKL